MARVAANGNRDTGFGDGGRAPQPDFGHRVGPDVLALQADGKIVVATDAWEGTFNPDGTRDDSIGLIRYGTGGNFDQDFGTTGFVTTRIGISDATSAIAVTSNGRIVVAGTVTVDSTTQCIFVARFFGDAL